jgi:hypothetical protein
MKRFLSFMTSDVTADSQNAMYAQWAFPMRWKFPWVTLVGIAWLAAVAFALWKIAH